MSGVTQQQNGPVGVSVKRELRQTNLLELFKKQKSNQPAKATASAKETLFGGVWIIRLP